MQVFSKWLDKSYQQTWQQVEFHFLVTGSTIVLSSMIHSNTPTLDQQTKYTADCKIAKTLIHVLLTLCSSQDLVVTTSNLNWTESSDLNGLSDLIMKYY